MGKYASWSDLEKNVPDTYQEETTPESYRTGMNDIAPSGLKMKEGRGGHYRDGMDGKGSIMINGYKLAMFE
jgi:hypothetical protein